jgi:hypothetical protein
MGRREYEQREGEPKKREDTKKEKQSQREEGEPRKCDEGTPRMITLAEN